MIHLYEKKIVSSYNAIKIWKNKCKNEVFLKNIIKKITK